MAATRDEIIEVEHGGGRRRAILHLPPAPSGQLPLVVNLHGGGATAGAALRGVGLRELADAEGFVLVCPEGTARPAGGFTWNAGPCLDNAAVRAGVDDVDFVRRLVAAIAERVTIDRRRVLATGFSAGAMMAHRLGAQAPDLFTAIAAVSGPLCVDDDQGGLPVPVLYVHGTADPDVPFLGGAVRGKTFPSVHWSLDYWLRRNLCDPTPEQRRLAPDVIEERWRPATRGGAEVVLCTIEGGGHAWPGRRWSWYRPERDGHLSMSIDATRAIWEFFARVTAE